MTITTIPTYNFSGTLGDVIATPHSQATSVNVKLSSGGSVLLEESYTPQEGSVAIPLSSIIETYADIASVTPTNAPLTLFDLSVSSDFTGEAGKIRTFYCIRGGHSSGATDQSFFANNWLTWQPQTQVTLYHTPRYLTYVATSNCSIKVKGYFADETSQTVTHSTLTAGTFNTIDATFGTLCELFDTQPLYLDLWVEGLNVESYVQRIMLTAYIDRADTYVWLNSLGGIDTAIFDGEFSESLNYSSTVAKLSDRDVEYDVDNTVAYNKHTGYLKSESQRLWVQDFFNSQTKLFLRDGVLSPIVVSNVDGDVIHNKLGGYSFDFVLAKQTPYLNLPRVDTPPLLEVVAPTGEVFRLAPRLNGFEGADLTLGEVLIPCQYANRDVWLKLEASKLITHGKDGEDAFITRIFTNTGNLTINGDVAVQLIAKVYKGAEDITDTIPDNAFSWERVSGNADTDAIWNAQHESVGATIEIDDSDVFRKANFNCIVTIN